MFKCEQMEQIILGPGAPECLKELVEIVHECVDNVILFYISYPRTFFALVLLIVFVMYYIRAVVQVIDTKYKC